jgi:hypothetical protein
MAALLYREIEKVRVLAEGYLGDIVSIAVDISSAE